MASLLRQACIIVDLNREPSRGLVFDIRVISAVATAPGVPVAQSLKYTALVVTDAIKNVIHSRDQKWHPLSLTTRAG